MNRPPRSILGTITAVAVSFVVLTYVLSLVIAAIGIIATQFGPDLLNLNGLLPIEAFTLIIPGILPANALVLVAVCMVIYSVCLWVAARGHGGFLVGLIVLTTKWKPRTAPNWLVVMPLIASSLLVVTVVLGILLNSAGVPIGTLNQNDLTQLFAGVTFAPLWEEVGFRITVLGSLVTIRTLLHLYGGRVGPRLVMIARTILYVIRSPYKAVEGTRILWSFDRRLAGARLVRVTGRILSAFLSPDKAKEKAGLPNIGGSGWRGIHWTEWVLILFTSLVFGIDHSLSGLGWGPGKVLTAGLSGFALGIVYLWYGSYANILLHWFFDFYNFIIFGALLGGIFSIVLGNLSFLSALFLGVVGFVFGIKWLIPRNPTGVQPTTSYIPPQL